MNIYKVSEVNKIIKRIFLNESAFYNMTIEGEVADFKYHNSGAMFFNLIDNFALIKCVMFKIHADRAVFIPKNGMMLTVSGDVNVYEKNGTYQFYVSNFIKSGEGLIQKNFKSTAEKLMDEGLFKFEFKKTFLKRPSVIGIVTSSDGAALQDIIQIISRRLPIVKLKIFSCLVQGVNAVESILRSLKLVANDYEVDSVIVCRGGGSTDDLNPFNDEKICRAVFNLEKPVISAIGHETDNCLLDLVADLRAPTPSAAAELVCCDKFQLIEEINFKQKLIYSLFVKNLNNQYFKLQFLNNKLISFSPRNLLEKLQMQVNKYFEIINYLIKKILIVFFNKLNNFISLLENLNPLSILKKGYCLVSVGSGYDNLIKSVKSLENRSENLNLVFHDGRLKIKILN